MASWYPESQEGFVSADSSYRIQWGKVGFTMRTGFFTMKTASDQGAAPFSSKRRTSF